MRLVVFGGSGAAMPELLDAMHAWPVAEERRPPLEVVLVGRSREKLELVAAECRARAPRAGAPLTIRTATDRRAALDGADVVLNQVRVGGLAARRFDESFPRDEGIPGEETMGPGGFANAVRTLPALRSAWTDVAEVAPTVLVVNLTNPAGMVVAAARREFDLQIVAVCDTPLVHTDAIAARLSRPVSRVRRRYVGMNHLGWYVPESRDELPALADLAQGLDAADVLGQEAVGAAYVRYYVHADRIAAAQTKTPTRAEALLQLEADLLGGYADGRARTGLRRGAGWYPHAVVPVLDAWLNGTSDPLVLGVKRRAQIAGLPESVMTELPVDASAPRRLVPLDPVPLPPIPTELLAAHANYEQRTVDAILRGASRDALVEALAANPMVRDDDQAARLVDTILASSPP